MVNFRKACSLIGMSGTGSVFSEAKRKPDIRGNWRGVVGHGVEKCPWHKPCKIERNDDVSCGSPPDLEISLIAEIAGMAGTGWINQRVASKSVYPIVC